MYMKKPGPRYFAFSFKWTSIRPPDVFIQPEVNAHDIYDFAFSITFRQPCCWYTIETRSPYRSVD